jgi:hypothetical protein
MIYQVTVKGSLIPIDIYTYDCYQDQVFREREHKAKAAIKPSVATLMNGMIMMMMKPTPLTPIPVTLTS